MPVGSEFGFLSESPPVERETSGSSLKGAQLCFILRTQTRNVSDSRYELKNMNIGRKSKDERPTSNIERPTSNKVVAPLLGYKPGV